MTKHFYAAMAIACGTATMMLALHGKSLAQAPAQSQHQSQEHLQSQSRARTPGSGATAAAARPTTGMGSKTMASCSSDTRRYCATTPKAVLTECLVSHWDRIASDCQDALGTPMRRGGPRRVDGG